MPAQVDNTGRYLLAVDDRRGATKPAGSRDDGAVLVSCVNPVALADRISVIGLSCRVDRDQVFRGQLQVRPREAAGQHDEAVATQACAAARDP